ncbi:hypothetical protein MNBD_GAMMA04-1512 [hydrothermal vent metagenome]|uniref:Uncharacterized protein n=1 Tax=hydrothermal vent metagenome TaxID=652676 RepID=A0A3B0WDM8_9ZZZZ
MKKFDVSEPRWRYWVNKEKNGMRCPRCGGSVEKEHHSYMLLIKKSGDIDSLICGTDGGFFCVDCPSIVLVREKFEDMIALSGEGGNLGYMVPGIINLKAISEEKQCMELGSDENPIPLIEFKEAKKKIEVKPNKPKKKGKKRKKRK